MDTAYHFTLMAKKVNVTQKKKKFPGTQVNVLLIHITNNYFFLFQMLFIMRLLSINWCSYEHLSASSYYYQTECNKNIFSGGAIALF